VLTVGLSLDSTNGVDPIEGLAIGSILMIMVYAGSCVPTRTVNGVWEYCAVPLPRRHSALIWTYTHPHPPAVPITHLLPANSPSRACACTCIHLNCTVIGAGGHVSGAHYNPAVTLGVFLSGRMGLPMTLSGCVRPLG
jgi:glycerol uptake facilitator-like aquaporin